MKPATKRGEQIAESVILRMQKLAAQVAKADCSGDKELWLLATAKIRELGEAYREEFGVD